VEYEQIQGLQEAIEKVGDQRLSDTDLYSRSLQISRAASLISRFDDGWVYYNHLWEVLREIGVEYAETVEEMQNARTIANLFRDIFGNPFHPAPL
ncbi:hypothetical protein R5W24_006662, partial [Gemmata sp. JC717]|uniref:hypothetical protein n=1 Tax=Gemmata algarum TaxID=2975278 RepID=UPI0021BBA1CC